MPPTDPTFLGLNEVEAVLIAALLAALIAIWGILSQRGITARQLTLEFIRKSDLDRDMIKARSMFIKLSRDPAGLAPHAHDPLSAEFKAIKMVLNEYEILAIGIQRGIMDDTTYRRWYRTGILYAWKAAAPFILARRNLSGNDALWYEFEEMARLYRKKRAMPRRQFFWGRFI